MVGPFITRTKVDPLGHRAPKSGLNDAGTVWRGTSRIIDKPARRRAQRRSRLAFKADARRAFVASQQVA